MMRKFLAAAVAMSLLSLPAGAMADTSLGIRGGTLGGGVELSHAFGQRTGVRINVDGYNYSKTTT